MSKHLQNRRPALQQKIDEAKRRNAQAEHIHTLVTLYEERGAESGMGAIAALIEAAHGPQDQRSKERRSAQIGVTEDKLLIEKQVLRELLKNPHHTTTPQSQTALAWIRDDNSLPHLQEELQRAEEKTASARKRKGHAQHNYEAHKKQRPTLTPHDNSHEAHTSHQARIAQHEHEEALLRQHAEHDGHDEHGLHSGHHSH